MNYVFSTSIIGYIKTYVIVKINVSIDLYGLNLVIVLNNFIIIIIINSSKYLLNPGWHYYFRYFILFYYNNHALYLYLGAHLITSSTLMINSAASLAAVIAYSLTLRHSTTPKFSMQSIEPLNIFIPADFLPFYRSTLRF